MFRTTDLRGVRVATSDLEGAVAAFRSAFGFPLLRSADGSEEASRFLGIGGAEIEMTAPSGDASPLTGYLDARGPGLMSLVLEDDDLEQAAAALAAKGVPVESARGAEGESELRLGPAHTHGAPLVLVERAKR